MGGYIDQKEVRQNRIAEIVGHRDTINLKAGESGNPLDAIDDVESFTKRHIKAKEQAYRSKLNRAERERLIAAIKARQSILRIGDTQQMGTNREEQVIVAQQTRHEAKVITQNISTEMAVSPLRALVARILGKLPEKAYKYLSATVILSMALSACSAINRSKEFETGQAESPAASAVMPDSVSDNEAVVEVTPSVVATETAQPMDFVEELLSRYLAGEHIDVSTLTQEEFIEFSAKLAEEKNEARGINPIIFDDGTGNPAFFDPNNDNRMMEYDGNADLAKTIEMFVPIAGYDEQGNLQFEVDGQLVTIGASAGVKWGEPITEYGDPRIEWPIGTNISPDDGMTRPERAMKNEAYPSDVIPAILLDKNMGQIYVAGPYLTIRSTFRFLVPEVDSAGHPLYARKILVTGGPTFDLYEEDSNLEIPTGALELDIYDAFYKNLTENWTYYLGWIKDQNYIYGLNSENLDNYIGLVSVEDTTPVLLGEKQNDQDLLSVATTMIIKAKVK